MSGPSLWDGLPARWRDAERDPLLVAYLDALDLEVARQHALVADFGRLWDVFRTEPALLPVLAERLGWTLDRAAPLALQRKVVSLLVPLYQTKGTRPGIVQVLRLFLGLECRVRAAWAQGWRLGVASLGGERAAFVADGGETALALPLRHTPWVGPLRVTLNGAALPAHAFWDAGGEILLATGGLDRDVAGGTETVVVPADADPATWRVAVNGVPRAEGSGWSIAGTALTVFSLARGDHLTVWDLSDRTPLGAGDVVVVTSTEHDATRLAPPPPAEGDEDTVWDHALRLFVEIPRRLSDDERRLVLRLLDVMASGEAQVVLLETPQAFAPRPWRLGEAGLGRGTRARRGSPVGRP